MSEIIQLYKDEKKTVKVYPKTVASEVYVDENTTVSSALEQKANKNDIGSPLIAGSITDMIDTSKVYVNTTDGNWYSWDGEGWVIGGVYNSQGVANKSISVLKTDFIETDNLAYNCLMKKYRILGSVGSFTLRKDFQYYMLFIPIDSSAEYTFFNANNIIKEDNYFWTKFATSTKTIEEIETIMASSTSFNIDGSIQYAYTSEYLDKYTLVTGENDKTLIIQISKDILPNYLEVIKGNKGLRKYTSWDDSLSLLKFGAYNKNEVNELFLEHINKYHEDKMIKFVKNGDVCSIKCGKITYTFKHQVNSNIALDTWRLYDGSVNGEIVYASSDIEAPIKEIGTNDFIGGSHGDEIFESINIISDGTELDINSNHNILTNNLSIFVKSTLYHCDTQNPAFTRYKKLEFTKDSLIISNRLDCLSGFIVERYTGCGLFSIYNDKFNFYSENDNNQKYPVPSETSTTTLISSKDIDEAFFYGDGYTLKLKALSGKQNDYNGSIVSFGAESKPRTKLYFDSIRNTSKGVQLNAGDKLRASFSITVS